MSSRSITTISLIATLYVVLTTLFAPISYQVIQIRISEILTVVPYLTPLAVPGLIIGTLIANLMSPVGIYDIIFGTMATALAAFLTAKMPHRWLAPLPPVLINAGVIGTMLALITNLPFIWAAIYVGLGQLIACYALGLPFLLLMQRYQSSIPFLRG